MFFLFLSLSHLYNQIIFLCFFILISFFYFKTLTKPSRLSCAQRVKSYGLLYRFFHPRKKSYYLSNHILRILIPGIPVFLSFHHLLLNNSYPLYCQAGASQNLLDAC